MLPYIILGAAAIFTFSMVYFIFSKLTPDNIPDNLSGFFYRILYMTLGSVAAFYVVAFLAVYLLT